MYQVDDYKEIPVPYAVFSLILNEAQDSVIDTRYIFVNERYCQLAGISREQLLGKRFTFVYPDERTNWFDYCYQAGVLGRTVHDHVFKHTINHWLGFTVAPVAAKNCVAYTFTVVDREQQLLEIEKRDHLTAQIILRLSEILSGEEEYHASINHVLHELSHVIHPDRLYVMETDKVTASNTFEWCAQGISAEMGTLQKIDYHRFMQGWEQYGNGHASIVLPDISVLKEKDPDNYEILARQGIRRLMASPFFQKGQLIGYLVADNYEESDVVNTQRLLDMASFFIGCKIINQRLLDSLEYLSRYDALTGVKNRNAMMEDCRKIAQRNHSIGVVFADVNNLKKINDEESHEAGDQAIQYVAKLLSEVFGTAHVYREGGDEFVVLLPDIKEAKFNALRDKLYEQLGDDHGYFLATGFIWGQDVSRINDIIHQADHLMYQNKAQYYMTHDRRH